MSYLNANIPPIYCKIRKEYLYDLKKHHGESEDCVIFGITVYQDVQSYLISCYQTVRVFGDCLSQRFSKNHMIEPKCQICKYDELELWNCFSYWPSVTCFDWLDGLKGKFLGLDKKFYHGKYLFTIDWAHPELISWILNILKFLKNISVHIYWSLITVIMQLSLIIVFCGMYIATLLITIGLTIKYKLHIGMQKI